MIMRKSCSISNYELTSGPTHDTLMKDYRILSILNCIVIRLCALIIRGLMKLMAQHGIVWPAKRLEVALHIYVGVSSSSMWIRWSFSSSRTEETAPKVSKRLLEFAGNINLSDLYLHLVISSICRDKE